MYGKFSTPSCNGKLRSKEIANLLKLNCSLTYCSQHFSARLKSWKSFFSLGVLQWAMLVPPEESLVLATKRCCASNGVAQQRSLSPHRDSHVGEKITVICKCLQESRERVGLQDSTKLIEVEQSSKCIYSRCSAAKPTTRDTTQANKNALTKKSQTAFRGRCAVCSKKVCCQTKDWYSMVFTYVFSVSNTTVEESTLCSHGYTVSGLC